MAGKHDTFNGLPAPSLSINLGLKSVQDRNGADGVTMKHTIARYQATKAGVENWLSDALCRKEEPFQLLLCTPAKL
jgi:hypothetical protein